MIDIDIQISISERSSGWATNYIITTSYLARYLSRFPSPKIPPPPPSASLKVFESVWITVNFNFALFLGGRNESTQIKKIFGIDL